VARTRIVHPFQHGRLRQRFHRSSVRPFRFNAFRPTQAPVR
jgi:hypothetical protein